MKRKSNDKKIIKPRGSRIDLTEEELRKIKTISEYLFMDQYQDTAAYPRFEECFGAFCLEKSIDLPKVYKTLCGRRRKYITFRRLIISFNQWKKNPNKFNADSSKFMDLIYNNLLKKSDHDSLGSGNLPIIFFFLIFCSLKLGHFSSEILSIKHE